MAHTENSTKELKEDEDLHLKCLIKDTVIVNDAFKITINWTLDGRALSPLVDRIAVCLLDIYSNQSGLQISDDGTHLTVYKVKLAMAGEYKCTGDLNSGVVFIFHLHFAATNRAGQSQAKFQVDISCTHLRSEFCRLLEFQHLTARRVRYERRRALYERDAWRDWAYALQKTSPTLASPSTSDVNRRRRLHNGRSRRRRLQSRRRLSMSRSKLRLRSRFDRIVPWPAAVSPHHRNEPRLPWHRQFSPPSMTGDQRDWSRLVNEGHDQVESRRRGRLPQFNVSAHLHEYTPTISPLVSRHRLSHRQTRRHDSPPTIREWRFLLNTRSAHAELVDRR